MSIKVNADSIMAVFLAALGLAMFIGGIQMDRLEIRHIHPASIPGLVPIMLGFFMMLCAGLLFKSAISKNATKDATKDERKIKNSGNSTKNLMMTLVCCLTFALLLVGNLPFIISSSLFISIFGIVFSWSAKAEKRTKIKTIVISIIIGVTAGTLISIMFQYGFLVRLP